MDRKAIGDDWKGDECTFTVPVLDRIYIAPSSGSFIWQSFHRLVLKSATGCMADRIIIKVKTKMIVTEMIDTNANDAAS